MAQGRKGTEHGTRSCYANKGCRRPECAEANRAYNNEHYRSKYAKFTGKGRPFKG